MRTHLVKVASIMRAQPLTYLLLVLGALFVAFGALLDLWFYAVAGIVLALYLIWRFLAFQSVIGSLQLQIRRNVDKTVVRRVDVLTSRCPSPRACLLQVSFQTPFPKASILSTERTVRGFHCARVNRLCYGMRS